MTKILLLAITVLQFSNLASADDRCLEVAIRVAKEQTNRVSIVSEIQNLPVAKPYLEAYRITLKSAFAPPRSEAYRIILMKSDCNTVSVIEEL